jgi:serine/threonine-protein kinase RsbW
MGAAGGASSNPARCSPERALDEFGGEIGGGQHRTVRIPWDASSVRRIRRAVVTDLRAREVLPQVVDEAEIVVSELVANAVRHARPLGDGTVRIHWKIKGPVVEVEVTDGGGPTVPRPAPPSTWAQAGRGLRIVRSLAHEWGVQEDRSGCTVWVALGGPSRRRTG